MAKKQTLASKTKQNKTSDGAPLVFHTRSTTTASIRSERRKNSRGSNQSCFSFSLLLVRQCSSSYNEALFFLFPPFVFHRFIA
mmetsp:Transcript_27903/g.67604  ORF Transcript_27903/g.67604 Transcript_27903/m.67604 type:complete len:83 (-) Transcript_27903:263-511(-)